MEESCEHIGSTQGCNCASKPSTCAQSLTEMDFERGIWQAALDGNVKRVRLLLDRGGDPDARDGSGYTALVRDMKKEHPVAPPLPPAIRAGSEAPVGVQQKLKKELKREHSILMPRGGERRLPRFMIKQQKMF